MWNTQIIDELQRRRSKKLEAGGEQRVQKQHSSGKLTARERINVLFDKASFCEINDMMESRCSDFDMEKKRFFGDGVITGYGKINGRFVVASSQDFTVNGGSLGEYQAKKICRAMDMAMDMKVPFISINDSGGARIEEGIDSLSGYGDIFLRNTKASGVIPQISIIMGPCAGGACYSPAINDFIFMVRKTGLMFITGPQVVKTVTNEDISSEDLGGARIHTEKSGVTHFVYDTDQDCLAGVRELLTYLPQNNQENPPYKAGKVVDLCRGLQEVVVENQKKCYDVKVIISAMIDRNSFFEVQEGFAQNAVIGFGRLNGDTVGFVANQPKFMGGVLDVNASDKIARFIRFCDCFNIPLVTFVDVPAFLPGSQQEYSGIIRHGAKVLYAYSEATVPKVTVVLRKAYGGAYIAMCSKGLGADIVYAWPIAQIAVMGAEGAVNIVGRKKIEAAPDKDGERRRQIAEYESKFLNPYIAAARGYVDEVITSEETREKVVAALEMLKSKAVTPTERKHGNIPL